MSPGSHRNAGARWKGYASVFSALGDETRLSLIARLTAGQPRSISQLAEGFDLTRQAVTKHLQVLESAGFVSSRKSGRERLFELNTRPFNDIEEYLLFVSHQWNQALFRLKSFVEEHDGDS